MSRLWTSAPFFNGGIRYFKGLSLGLCGVLGALALSSCGGSPQGYSGGVDTKTATASQTLKPLTLPPAAGEKPPLSGMTGAEKTADGLPVLTPKGTNTDLFSEKLSNETARMDRLENAVQELRNDFDSMAPAIVRLVAIEKDIQNLIKQLEVLTGSEPAPPMAIDPVSEEALIDAPAMLTPPPAAAPQTLPPVAPSPSAQEPAPQIKAEGPPAPTASPTPPPPVVKTEAAVQGFRVGEHADKTRLVLDVRGHPAFGVDVDNQEKILVVDLGKTAWETAAQKSFDTAPILSSYRTETTADGSLLLIISLKKEAKIIYQGFIKDEKEKGGRIIIDLR